MRDSLNQYLSKLNNYIGVFIMGNKSYLILSGVLLLSILFWSACNNPGSSLEESVKPYLELQAVDGASNVTMTVNRGTTKGLDSYFAVDFTNFDSNGIVREGLTEGWCLDYQKPIDQNNDVHEGIKMFNTFGSENWKSANYLMNIKNELKQNDPSITYKEIQVALWSLIEKPSFNIDKALSEGTMPSRLMTNGSPNFSVEKTKGIINKVRNEVDDFVYKPGTPVIVYSNTAEDDQDTGFVSGETAWAYSPSDDGSVDSDISTEFCDNTAISGNNWGWVNGTYSESSDEVTLNVIAGAGGCDLDKGTYVGTFTFTYDSGVLDYTLDLTVDNDFSELQIYASTAMLSSSAPGSFPTNINIDSGIGSTTGEITGLSGNDIYIAVHLGAE